MMQYRGVVRGGILSGLLLLAAAVQADEAAAVKAIEKSGGKIEVDAERAGKPVVGVTLSGSQVTDVVLKKLKDLKNVQKLELFTTEVTDVGLKELKGLKSLQTLTLFNAGVTDRGLKELKELKDLQSLNLFNTKVSNQWTSPRMVSAPKRV